MKTYSQLLVRSSTSEMIDPSSKEFEENCFDCWMTACAFFESLSSAAIRSWRHFARLSASMARCSLGVRFT